MAAKAYAQCIYRSSLFLIEGIKSRISLPEESIQLPLHIEAETEITKLIAQLEGHRHSF
jgi:hypothetical protein